MSFVPSEEQQAIINEIIKGNNVYVTAVAGSGKTTTVLEMARQTNKKILQITYNSLLKNEVREKSKYIENMEVHSYHSLCVKYYDRKGFQDNVISTVITKNVYPITKINFDILVIDETQDMTLLFFGFTNKIIKDNSKTIQVLLLGDTKQAIYEFKGADSRFLSHCNKIWNRVFIELPLSTSYRLTDNIAYFVNKVMIGTEKIKTVKSGPTVSYYIDDTYNADKVYNIIHEYISSGYKYDDIFILAPSVKKNNKSTPLSYLENKLCENNIPCFVPSKDDDKLDESVLKGKITFCSFHQSKGRERPIVIIYNFDENWFTFFGKGYDTNVCPNELYVAVTRASYKLILIQDKKSQPLPFFKVPISNLLDQSFINVFNYSNIISKKDNKESSKPKPVSVSDLVKFIGSDIIDTLHSAVSVLFTNVVPIKRKIDIPLVIKTENNLIEQVSDLNGIAIMSLWENNNYDTITIKQQITNNSCNHILIKESISVLPDKCIDPSSHLQLANIYQAITSGYIFKIAQIKIYDWLTNEMVKECHDVIDKYLQNGPYIYENELKSERDGEVLYARYNVEDFGMVEIHGRIDAMNDDDIWEFKCVDYLTLEHYLQVIVYAWIWNSIMKDTYGRRNFYLLNIKTEEMYTLDTSSPLLNDVITLLFENKYKSSGKCSDIEFIKNCVDYKEQIDVLQTKIPIQKPITYWMGTLLRT